MKIVDEIVGLLTDADPTNRFKCDTDTDGNIHVSQGLLIELMSAKLKPVRELLERIKSDVVCEGVPLKLGDADDKECSPKMALSSIGEKAIAALGFCGNDDKPDEPIKKRWIDEGACPGYKPEELKRVRDEMDRLGAALGASARKADEEIRRIMDGAGAAR